MVIRLWSVALAALVVLVAGAGSSRAGGSPFVAVDLGTLTAAPAARLFPLASADGQLTVVSPIGTVLPDGGLQTTVGLGSTSSFAVTV